MHSLELQRRSGKKNVTFFKSYNNNDNNNVFKYEDLTMEIQSRWNVQTKVIPVIIGATGTISKSLRKYLSNITGKHDIKELQKTAILGTAHVLREVLMYKYKTFNMGNNITCTINCNHTTTATLRTTETWFVSGI
jgi:hypothetical protein